MATNLTLTSTYAGEVLAEMLSMVSTGNEAVEQGIINVETNIIKSRKLPRIKMANLIQDRAVTPTSAGTVTADERSLTPLDFMVYLEFNPRDYEDWWAPFHPTGQQLVFRELSPEVQIPFLREIFKEVSTWMGKNIWQGNTGGSAPDNKFDGIKTKALADADVIDIATPLTLSAANIQAEMARVYAAVPVAVRNHPNFKFIVSDATKEFYMDAVIAQANKGHDFTGTGPMTYKGKQIVSLVGMPDDTIIATQSGTGVSSSNIHLGVDWDRTTFEEVIQVERLQNNSELFFAKMLMKADTAITWGQELVLYGA